MKRRLLAGTAAAASALALWVGWGMYVRRSTERVDYTLLESFDGVELREYPERAVATTVAPSQGEAFQRLFRYIDGANVPNADIPMTAPVATTGEAVKMTAPVGVGETEEGIRMSFYLPRGYSASTAPTPRDSNVVVASEPAGKLAVKRFIGPATPGRIDRQRKSLLESVTDRGLKIDGDAFVFRYSDPYTPPFMQETEVAVPVA
jgi:effector-binding domain-containing protein